MRGDKAAATQAALAVEGVTSAEASTASHEKDAWVVRVEAKRDVRSELAAALVKGGLGVLELARTERERELESVFLKLASGDAARSAEEKSA